MNRSQTSRYLLSDTSSTTTTNDTGYYVMTNIPPGGYDVKAELSGLRSPETIEGAKVLAGLTTTLNFALKTAEVVTLEGNNGNGCQTPNQAGRYADNKNH